MSTISRNQFEGALANHAINLHDPELKAAVARARMDVEKLDQMDGKSDGQISGRQALEHLYDELDAIDKKTAGLGSKRERAVYDAVKSAAVAPSAISAEQGKAIAAAARQILAEDRRGANGISVWAPAGISSCENPALSRPDYAGAEIYKCNVLAGESVTRAGVPFPINEHRHYVNAGLLPAQSQFFDHLASVDQAREGDLISIYRGNYPGHVEVITGVERAPDGKVIALKSIGAHEHGVAEGTGTAASFLKEGRHVGGALVTPGETFRILRPMTPPSPVSNSVRDFSTPIKG